MARQLSIMVPKDLTEEADELYEILNDHIHVHNLGLSILVRIEGDGPCRQAATAAAALLAHCPAPDTLRVRRCHPVLHEGKSGHAPATSPLLSLAHSRLFLNHSDHSLQGRSDSALPDDTQARARGAAGAERGGRGL